MSNTLQDAINAAEAQASTVPAASAAPANTQAPVVIEGGAPPAPMAMMPGFSMSMAQTGMECDSWIAFNKDGYGFAGKAEGYKTPFKSAVVTVDPQEILFTLVLRINEKTYWKTNDGQSVLFPKAEDPKTWQQALVSANRMGIAPYNAADFRMTVAGPVIDMGGNPIPSFTEGTTLMLGLAKTHGYEFFPFVAELIKQGVWTEVGDGSVTGDPITIELGMKEVKKARTWWVPTFTPIVPQ